MQEANTLKSQESLLSRLRSSEKVLRITYCVAVALIVFFSLWLGAGRRYLNFDNPREDIVNLQAKEVDYHMLYPSIESKATFADTFDWWHEAWRADEWVGAYWRPLSMQVWWIESHLFGEDRSSSWMRVSLALSIVFDVLLFLLVWRLTKRRIVALGGLALFALPLAWLDAVNPLIERPRIWSADLLLCQGWKDQPDLFANCLTLGALILAFDRRYAWALLCAALAPCFKESGLMTFPLLLGIVFYQGDLKKLPKWIYLGVAAFLALYMFARWSAGPMVFRFHTHGGDAGAWARYSSAMVPSSILGLGSVGAALAGIGVFALLVYQPKSLIVWLATVLTTSATAIAMVAAQKEVPLDVAFAEFILGIWPVAVFVVWLWVTRVLIKQREFLKPAAFFALSSFFLAIPFALVTGALEHVLTLSRAFQAGYGACVTAAVFCAVAGWYRRLTTRSVPLINTRSVI